MSWFISTLAAAISGVVGLFLAGFIASACVSWYHISSREGASGYYVMFMALGGGIAGFLIGFITARVVVGHFGPGFGKELGGGLGAVVVVAGISAILCRFFADVPPRLDGLDLRLEVEFRFPNTHPATKPPTAEGDWSFSSMTGTDPGEHREGKINTAAARYENGQWIVPTEMDLFTEQGKWQVTLAPRTATQVMGFSLPMPGRPGAEFESWSMWLPRQEADGQPWPADKMSCRFRIQKIPPPPQPPSMQEAKAAEEAHKEAAFLAIPTDAPVQRWFEYLEYDQPQTERALKLIAARTNLVDELGRLALDEDATLAAKALFCISKLPTPGPGFNAGVEAAGHDLIARIQKVNETTAEADPGYEGAALVSTRFSGWISAVRALRRSAGGDFTPELKRILELSRVRPESHAMRMDVCRVASYYMHEWTGLAPLPSDPKPR